MRISSIFDFYLGIPTVKFPYQIPNYILPEIFQWCADNKSAGAIEASIVPDNSPLVSTTNISYYFSFDKLVFNLNIADKNLQKHFLEHMHENRYKFWKKKFKFNWRFMSTKRDEKLYLKSNAGAQDLVSRLYQKILNMNYLFGTENWCLGQYNSISSSSIFPMHMYLNYVYLFNEEDKNLYKVTYE